MSTALFPLLAVTALALAGCDTGLLVHTGGRPGDASDAIGLDGTGDGNMDGPSDHAMDVPGDSNRPCTTDMDCMGNPNGGHCDLATQMCHSCGQTPNTCPMGQYCDTTFHCVAGCASDPDCTGVPIDAGTADATGGAGSRCDVANHVCVQCLGDPDCPPDLVCHHNQCVMGCSASRACPAGSDCCNGVCVDLLADTDHCGSCLHACDTGNACCHGICYDLATDPRHCGTCTNLCSIINATASCTAGMCTVATCTPGFGDCNGDPTDGCEAPLNSDPNHCGTCSTVCTTGPHVVSTCDSGVCHSTCAPGYLHCSTDPSVGCEVNPATDPNNCGVCGNVCTGAHVAMGGCSMGACTVAACDPGYTDCDGIASNGCEANTQSDVLDCGACFHVCPSGPFSSPVCTAGTCSVTCLPGHGDCNMSPADGCEADFSTDVNHCGGCATACAPRPNATAICSSGSCAFICSGSFQDCNTLASDGCEANLLTDTSNCGACSNVCTAAHGTAACLSGACTIASCSPGFANCNGVVSDGCETPTTADPLNCGGCNVACAAPAFATATCSASTCGFTCLAGHANCDGVASNGCETDLSSTLTHCGTCGTSCPTPAHAAPTCTSGTCGYTCLSGFADCNGLASDGCEVSLGTDVNNCGTCRNACAIAHATPTCMAGACEIGSCLPGFADCNGMVSDGCETGTTADVSNCGACLNTCPMGMFATATCTSSMCGITCQAGHGNCNGTIADGCEVTFANDPNHCGSCSTVCPTYTNTLATCTSSVCGFICQVGFRDCNGTATDGCERNIETDVNNCGSCGMVCTAPNGTPACNAGSCAIGSCNAGYADCDGTLADGCETHTAVDSNNCGSCGNVCTGGRVCVSGVCTLVNPFPSTGVNGAFNPAVNTVLAPGVYNYTTINIPAGVTVSTNGTGVLDLRAQGSVMIAGIIDVSGGNGGNGVRPTGGGGGGTTAQRTTAATGIPGAAGAGGQAPAGANAIGCITNGLGGTNGGGSGSLGALTVGGGGGGGPAGGGGGLIGGGCNGGTGGGGAPPGAGGQAGGPPYDGTPGQSGYDPCNGLGAGGGGGSIGSAASTDLAITSTFQSGSAGGGGSASYGTGLSGAEGGGGGGAGAVRIASGTTITITGSILANGGAGGAGSPANSTCSLQEGGAGGGGGSGGAIYLAAPTLSVSGTVSAAGGAGGPRGSNMTGGDGGAGGLGRIRITTVAAMCSLTGTFNPPLNAGCAPASVAGRTYVASYPF